MAGYSGTPLVKKLGIKEGHRLAILGPPQGFARTLGKLPARVTTVNGLEGYPLTSYLTHIVMHGTESLSAAAILLHRAGQSMGDVGFLDYLDVARPLG